MVRKHKATFLVLTKGKQVPGTAGTLLNPAELPALL